jgi:teichuronic acid biosynthesis glycosyltransferase TuaH
MSTFPAQSLIFVSLENWDEIWRRNQFICAGLSRRYPALKILFVGVARDASHALRRGRLGAVCAALHDDQTWTVPEYSNVSVTRPLKLWPNSLDFGRRCNEAIMRSHVSRVAAQLQLQAPVLWLNPHDALHMAGRMDESALIYDITDDWTHLTQSPKVAALIARQDAELCRRADAVIVCSQQLFDSKRELASNLHLIANGVDAAHYAGVLDESSALPAAAAAWPRPVFGYTGTIHPDRVDVDLLEAVARGLTSGVIVLIGPNYLEPPEQARLEQTGRVIFQAPVSYRELPAYMRAFDVCITPHRVTPFTESLNPIKLWEYLAAGKPMVATPVAGFRDFPHLVHLAGDASTFLEALETALQEDSARGAQRQAEAQRHSWQSRLDAIESVIEQCFARRLRAVESHTE